MPIVSDGSVNKYAVVITGMGLTIPPGLSVNEARRRWLSGESAIAASTRLDAKGGFSAPLAEVPPFDFASSLKSPKNEKFMTPSVRFAMRAAKDAVDSASLDLAAYDPYRIAVYTGSGQTGLESTEFFRNLEVAGGSDERSDFANMGGRASRAVDRYFSLKTLSNAGLGLLSMEFGARGPSNNFVQDDTASAVAIACGMRDLEDGRCDLAIVGGYDSLLNAAVYIAYRNAGRVAPSSDDALRPFDPASTGLALGEGAGFLVLERGDDAARRGAPIVGELVGVGSAIEIEDAADAKASDCGMRAALRDASNGRPINAVVAHGVGIPDFDRREAAILEATIGPQAPVTALKGLTGYLGAATAAVELILSVHAARAGILPSAVRHTSGSAYNLSLVSGEPRRLGERPLLASLSWSWFGRCAAIAALPWRLND